MDKLIKRFDSTRDGALTLCEEHGVAYQMGTRVEYGGDYYAKVKAYEGSEIAKKVNEGRVALLARHLLAKARVLDWGAGSGAFIHAAAATGFETFGYDINPLSRIELQNRSLLAQDPYLFDAVTMWDTIEHMEQPGAVFQSVKKGAHLFASIPIFEDLKKVHESKHYRPGEHLYYWTAKGFTDWMALWGFRLLEQSAHEVEAGRESIAAFAFCRDLPDYHDHIAAYKEIHATRHYGDSATEEYLEVAAKVVKERTPKSILDFGCGRSDLAVHFWLDGARRIEHYDPAIGKYKRMPEGKFDLVFCLDVMEHVPMQFVDQIFAEIRNKSGVALMSISTKPARAKLPDGRNAHVTLLTKSEWTRWVKDVFFNLRAIPSKHEHELIFLAGVA